MKPQLLLGSAGLAVALGTLALCASWFSPGPVSENQIGLLTISGGLVICVLGVIISLAKPLNSLWRLILLMLVGGVGLLVFIDGVLPSSANLGWLKNILDGLLMMVFLTPILSWLKQDSLLLAQERARASTALAAIDEGIIVLDLAGRVEYLNSEAEKLTGWSLESAYGKPLSEVFPVAYQGQERLTSPALECIRLGCPVNLDLRATLNGKHGRSIGIEESASPIHDHNGQISGAVLVFRDVTAKRRDEDELNLSASVFSSASEGIIITDSNGLILRVNKAFSEITGYSEEDVRQKNPRILSSGKHELSFYQAMWERLQSVGEWQGEVWNRRKSGEVYPEWLKIRALCNDRGEKTHYVGIFSDISESIRDQEYIFRLAYYDSLTSVANRALFMDHLALAISNGRRHGKATAVLFIDMDRFKLINDSLGHSAGDLLLQKVAEILTASVREIDTVARFGGDEFVVCVPDIGGMRSDVVQSALKVAEKIHNRLSQPFNLQGHEVATTPSIGLAICPWDGETPTLLIKHADTAMYHAKAQGRDNVQLFSEDMLSVGSERLKIQSGLRKALEKGEFLVYYQAQVDLETGQIVGAEALLRWNNPDLGWTSPTKFIPVAEDTSLILPIGDWVFQQVCLDWKLWEVRLGHHALMPRFALNYSPRQLIQPDFVTKILRQLAVSGISPDFMELEITEATLMHNTESVLSVLNQLRCQGIRIAVDDFGVGYSSLSYLKMFPIDVLKIDQSFIRDINTDSNDAQIVSAIVAMGHSLGLRVLAEGVETEGQLDFLCREGCHEAQGFLLGPPMTAEEFAALLKQGGNLIDAARAKSVAP